MITIVVAHDPKFAIGKDGWMPWNLPEDLKSFRKLTLNHDIVMGRTTFDAMKKPLPKRHTFVVTRNQEYVFDHEDVTIVHDFDALLKKYKDTKEDLMICGGSKIYAQALPYVDDMWISLVDEEYPADTFFPAYDVNDFMIETKERKQGFTLIHYKKK